MLFFLPSIGTEGSSLLSARCFFNWSGFEFMVAVIGSVKKMLHVSFWLQTRRKEKSRGLEAFRYFVGLVDVQVQQNTDGDCMHKAVLSDEVITSVVAVKRRGCLCDPQAPNLAT